jgi:histone H2B
MLFPSAFLDDIFERIAAESDGLLGMNDRNTLAPREIQTAIRLALPG